MESDEEKPDPIRAAMAAIPIVLQIQLTLGGGNAETLSTDRWALGYVLGFHDGVLQVLEVSDQTEVLAAVAGSYHKIFGGPETGAKLLRQSMDLQHDQTFKQGMLAGGKEAIAYLQDRKSPMGLAAYLRGDKPPKETAVRADGSFGKTAAVTDNQLSKDVEEKVASALRKTAAVTAGSIKGVVSGVNTATSSFPRWIKVILLLVAIFLVLSMLGF